MPERWRQQFLSRVQAHRPERRLYTEYDRDNSASFARD
jgi:hypothetical protein